MNWRVLRKVLVYIKARTGLLVVALVFAAAGVGFSLWVPVLIGDAVNYIVGAGQVDFAGMLPILVSMAVAVGISAVCSFIMTLLTNRVAYGVVKDMRVAAFGKLQDVPLSYIDGRIKGDLISRVVNDVDQLSDGLLQGFAQLFTGVITIIGTLIFMLSINPGLALVVILITPVSLFVSSFIARKSFHTFQVQMEERGEVSGLAEEVISGHTAVKAFGYAERAESRMEEINGRLRVSGVRSQFFSSLTNPGTRFINALVYAGVGIFGALSAISGGISVGMLSSFLIYAGQYTKPFNEISGVVTELQTALASAERLFEIIEQSAEAADAPEAIAKTHSEGRVNIEDMSFSYSPDTKLIEGLFLYTQTGERVAIVGPTGAGKSTLVNLLMRFYDADSGSISIDGVNIKSIRRNDLRGLFGMVLQESWLFTGTVRENIAFGRPDATLEEVVAAAKAASIHSFIKRLPQGYDTVLSGEGGGVSAGQMQLLCIARVMLTKPDMLVLDEATSSIDTRTEIKIQSAFARLMEGRTSFIVAHRLSTIREADLILVMRDGAIVEQGSHAELLAKKGFYANLYSSQFEH